MGDVVTKQIVVARAWVGMVRERCEPGQSLVEYAIILGFVAILVLVALRFLQPATSTLLNNVANSI
jgi:Flp pilus assembly pilin Flp